MSAKLTREALEVLRDCDLNKMPCSECLPHKPPEQACYRFQVERGELAALALRLAEGLKEQVKNCGHCGGRGWNMITVPAHDPNCDGSCDNCPIPVQEQEQCGGCAAARALLAELEG